MKINLRLAEKVFTVIALLLFTGAIVPLVRQSGGAEQSDSDPLLRVIFYGSYAISLCFLALHWKGFTRIPSNIDIPVLLLTGVAIFSYHWSAMPGLTFRHNVGLVGTTIFAVYLGTCYSLKEQLRLLAWALGIAALLSVIFALFLPRYGLDVFPFQGVWRGVYSQKNLLGRFMTVSSLVFLLIALSSQKYRWVAWTGFSLSAILILLSTSKTSLIVFFTLLILLPFYRALRWQYSKSVPLYIIAILLMACVAVWVTTEAETLLSALGKDATLSGRTELWSTVIAMIEQHPWLGYGYSGFWSGLNAFYLREIVGWPAPHAHNGILDLWLDLGLLGVSIFALSFLMTLVKAVTWVRQAKTWEDFWPIIFLTVMLLFNLTQSSILGRNNIIWVLYVAINVLKPAQHYSSVKLPIGTT